MIGKFIKANAVLLLSLLCTATAYGAAGDMSKAERLYAAKEYSAAAGELTAVVRQGRIPQGQAARVYYMLASCYYSTGLLPQAEKLYGTVVSNYPSATECALAKEMLGRMGKPIPAASGTRAAALAAGSAATPTPSGSNKTALKSNDESDYDPRFTFDKRGNSQYGDSPYDKVPDSTRVFYREESGGHMVVDGYVNGRPLPMWFDTGASAHFGKNHLQAAGVPVPDGPPDTWTSGWAGKRVPAWHMLADVRIGGLSRRIPITVEESMSLPPLIGTDVTRGYELEIDRGAHCLNLKRADNRPASSQLDSMYDLPCRTVGHDVVVKLGVARGDCDAIIDTGSSNTIISLGTAHRLGIEVPSDAPSLTFTGVGGSTIMRIVYLDVHIGPIRRQGFPVCVGGMGVNAIGQDLMSGWRFRVDRDAHLVRFFH